jgi:hypothetical protein
MMVVGGMSAGQVLWSCFGHLLTDFAAISNFDTETCRRLADFHFDSHPSSSPPPNTDFIDHIFHLMSMNHEPAYSRTQIG